MSSNHIIFMDFETTGLVLPASADDAFQPRAIELALIKTDSELNVIDTFECLMNPMSFITPEITKITGITNSMVESQKPFSAYYKQISRFFLGVETLVAHNISFDLSVLYFELARIKKERAFPYPPVQICTAQMTEQMYGKRMTLKATYEKLIGEKYNQLHRALDDTQLLLTTYKAMVNESAKTTD